MEPKKNPKANLNKNSGLYLQIGLIIVLLIAWGAIEFKTFEKPVKVTRLEDVEDIYVPEAPRFREEQPKTVAEVRPKQIKQEIKDKFEVVEDDTPEEILKDIIEPTELPVDMDIPEVKGIIEVDPVDEEIPNVPFYAVEIVPVFPGCENEKTNEGRKQCMNEKVKKFIYRKFDTGLGGELGLQGMNVINVEFKIDKNGDVVDIRSRSPHPRLDREAQRVVQKLPKMTPGKQSGRNVGVIYNLPIRFKVQ